MALALAAAVALPAAISAQSTMTLTEAMERARSSTPGARALAAASEESAARVEQARSGYLPRVDVTHRVQRGDQPVFVFSSLLSQRRFEPRHFDVASLNEPAPLTNVESAVTIEQPVFDGGRTRLAVRGAELQRALVDAERTVRTQDLAVAAAEAFVRVLQLEEGSRAAAGAVAAAESDLERARARRDAGLETDAGVLTLEVHLAAMRQRQLATSGDLAVARVRLNERIGAPLDATPILARPAPPTAASEGEALVREALERRTERQQSELRLGLAENARRLGEAAFLPSVRAQGAWSFHGSDWTNQRASWLLGAEVTLNVFRGFADTARLAEMRHAESRAAAERDAIVRAVEVDVRVALARLEAARAGELVGRAALAQALESQRIVRDRYESGLAAAADVLRAAEAVLDAEARATTAETDVVLQAIALDRAVGRL